MANYGYGTWKKAEKDISLFPIVEDKPLNIDWELFNKILSFRSHSMSKTQDLFADWIVSWVELNIVNCIVDQDKFGNIYIIKGDADLYPCMVAHLDINQDEDAVEVVPIKVNNWLLGIDAATGVQAGLGADDKNGVLAALTILQNVDVLKVFLPMDEEVGCVGTAKADMSFFTDCSMMLQLDRNSYAGPEFCSYTNGVSICSHKFLRKAKGVFKKYGYFDSTGMYTDVGQLKKRDEVTCIAANIGCGYFDEHSNDEVTYIPALENAINFAYELIIQFGSKKWHHVATKSYEYKGYGTKFLDTPKDADDKGKNYYDWNDWYEEAKETERIEENQLGRGFGPDNWINGVHYIADKDIPYEDAQEYISQGDCPCCDREYAVTEDLDGMGYCNNCSAYWNIPEWYGKENKEQDLDIKL